MAAKRKFNKETKELFQEIQVKILQVQAKLLKPKLTADAITSYKEGIKDLRAVSKSIKTNFYRSEKERFFSEMEALIQTAKEYPSSSIYKTN
jgi:hypothetical protein